jgi:anti-anti-sigma factor
MAESVTYKLEQNSDISKAEMLHEKLESHLNAGVSIVIDASQVERIDTSALQVLAALFATMKTRHLHFSITSPSDVFLKSASLLGLSECLCLTH